MGAQITILRGNASSSPIHCCEVTKPPYLFSGELCTSPLHCLRTSCAVVAPSCASLCSKKHKSDVVDVSSGRRYATDQWHNVPLLRSRGLNQLINLVEIRYLGPLLQLSLFRPFLFRPNHKIKGSSHKKQENELSDKNGILQTWSIVFVAMFFF